MALDEGRNIVPLMMEGFDFGSPAVIQILTGKLASLKRKSGLCIIPDYFPEAMDRLRKEYLSVPVEDVHLHSLSAQTKEITEAQKVSANETDSVETIQLTAEEWFERSYVFGISKNFDESIRCSSEAIRLQPDFAEAYYNRGLALDQKGDLDGALKDYDEALRLKPDFAEAYNNRGIDRRLKGDLGGAIADSTEALRLKPDLAKAYYSRGQARRDKGDLDNAITDYTEAIRFEPDDADYYSGRGNLLSAKGDNLIALSDFQKASELKPEDGSFRASLVRVLKSFKRIDDAKEQERIARELIQKEIEYNQACFEAICGNADKALKLLKIALDKKQESKEWARKDPDLENIRNNPRFKALVGE